jgi:[NiFe] hydrogenase assembly HybE family chaperone
MQYHTENPGPLIEATFKRIQAERMAGLPLLNPTLEVVAVEFARRDEPHAEWLGVLVTPWSMGLMLLPASADWPETASHERAFRDYPAGTFAFLGNREAGLGDYLVCPLLHEMSQFADQETAVLTARASLLALQLEPPQPDADPAAPAQPGRRKFLTLGG